MVVTKSSMVNKDPKVVQGPMTLSKGSIPICCYLRLHSKTDCGCQGTHQSLHAFQIPSLSESSVSDALLALNNRCQGEKQKSRARKIASFLLTVTFDTH